MHERGTARRVYALTDYTVERASKGWFYGRTSRFGDAHTMKGPYSSERSVAFMIARELIKENSGGLPSLARSIAQRLALRFAAIAIQAWAI